ncbi:MAG TPA: FAD-binding oxidoreductase [Nitrososphaerales archaeon]|nr:FAD-binding oxidoreductase [Nitrososphaerales archaeon]
MKVISAPEQLDEYSHDGGFTELRPRKVVVAEEESDVLEALEDARSAGVSLTPRASGTSIPGQAVGVGVVLLQSGRRVAVGPGPSVAADPGVLKVDLNDLLAKEGRWIPVDPASYKSCSIGGMVANNSAGARTFKYRSTADYVQEMRVVLPEEGLRVIAPMKLEDALGSQGSTGQVARLIVENLKAIEEDAPRVTKNSTGYRLEKVVRGDVFDLPKLFSGSEGTLGVMVEVRLSTIPRPPRRILLIFETGLAELDSIAADLRPLGASAIELVDKKVFRQTGRESMVKRYSRTDQDYLVFCEFDGSGEDEMAHVVEKLSADPTLSGYEPLILSDPSEVARAWDVRNETLNIAVEIKKGGRMPTAGIEDIVVPPSSLGMVVKLVREEFERRGLEYIMYGHAGDANLHARPLLDPRSASDMHVLRDLMEDTFEATWKMGGSMSGEHGDGRLRASFVARQYRRSYEVMKRVKQIYDPKSLLNPGVKIV